MSNGKQERNVYGRLWKLWAMVCKLIMDGARSAETVAEILQSIVDEPMGETIHVNLNKNPFIPKDLMVKSHRRGNKRVRIELRDDQLYLDGKKIILYLSECQKNGGIIRGFALREELTGKKVINANLLDFLLMRTELIPKSWNNQTILFLGTEYQDSALNIQIRCLSRLGRRWICFALQLAGQFPRSCSAALAA